MNASTLIRLTNILKKFGTMCYWHGEETGDYEMEFLDNPAYEKVTFDRFMEDIIDAVEQV